MCCQENPDFNKDFAEGYASALSIYVNFHQSMSGERRVNEIWQRFVEISGSINKYKGNRRDVKLLKGYVMESLVPMDFNLRAQLAGSNYRAIQLESTKLASVDVAIVNNLDGVVLKYSFKDMKSPKASARAQATSYYEHYRKRHPGEFDKEKMFSFFRKQGVEVNELNMYDSIYSGQKRLVPKRHLPGARAYLKRLINKEKNPLRAQALQETLDNLTDHLETPDGIKSEAFTEAKTRQLAKKGKIGAFEPCTIGYTTENFVSWRNILNKGWKAGQNAAMISFLLEYAPLIVNAIVQGNIDLDDFIQHSPKAATQSCVSFASGFLSCSLLEACKFGKFGEALKSVTAEQVGTVVALTFSIIKDVVIGIKENKEPSDVMYDILKDIFIAGCAYKLGTVLGSGLGPFGFIVGSTIGSILGSFFYTQATLFCLSFAEKHDVTFFGFVKQDYQLPERLLINLGLDRYDFDRYMFDSFEFDSFEFDRFKFDRYDFNKFFELGFVRRGVIGVRKIGYIYEV